MASDHRIMGTSGFVKYVAPLSQADVLWRERCLLKKALRELIQAIEGYPALCVQIRCLCPQEWQQAQEEVVKA